MSPIRTLPRNSTYSSRWMKVAFVFILIVKLVSAGTSTDADNHGHADSVDVHDDAHGGINSTHANHTELHSEDHGSLHVAGWNYDYVSAPFLFTSFVVAICILKIIYHHIRPLAASFPESCLLILLGVLLGLLFLVEHAEKTLNFLKYDAKSFFLILLPPIILEAAYSLRDRAFVENIGTILLYAVVGTILNIAIVGPLIYGAWYLGAMENWLTIGFLECLIFSALIAAVDPVAVLAIFQEVGVNKMLYFMVFGESLFNDAVTVVIYNMFVAFSTVDHIGAPELFLGLAKFFAVSFGAMAIGIVFGLLTGLITKFTSHVRIVEPVIFFALAYLSYLCAEMVHFSGIISIICCGLLQGYYAMENISSKSYISIVYFSKVTSSVMESLIFIILGVMMVYEYKIWLDWSTGFTFWALIFCLLARFAVVFLITYIINTFLKGIRTISYQEQFIMAYGGLRGAISFSLVFMLDPRVSPAKNTLLTATCFIIMFTVFLQGISIKPLVKAMRIKLAVQDSNIFNEVNRAMIENSLAGVEEIIGHRGTHYWTAVAKYISQRFVRPAIQKNPQKKSCALFQLYQEAAIQQQLHRNASQSDVPKQAALWSQMEMLDSSAMSGSASAAILQAQDDYVNEALRKESAAYRKESQARKQKPPALKLDSPKELLILRDMLNSPANKTMHYVYDKDLKSPSRKKFADQVAHMAAMKWRLKSIKRNPSSSKMNHKNSADNKSHHLHVPLLGDVTFGGGSNKLSTNEKSKSDPFIPPTIVEENETGLRSPIVHQETELRERPVVPKFVLDDEP